MILSWTYLVHTCSLQEPLLLLDVSTLERPVLHFAVSTPQGLELQLDLSVQQEPLLLLDVSTLQGLSYTWT